MKNCYSPLMEENYPQPCVNLVLSQDFHVIALFIKPKSKSWPLVRQYCQRADFFYEENGYTAACFKPASSSMRYLFAISDMTYGWKSVYYFVNGKKIDGLYSLSWMRCYLDALSCNDWRAHCQRIYSYYPGGRNTNMVIQISIQRPDEKTTPEVEVAPERYLLPCKSLNFCPDKYTGHPSSLGDLFQAEAVSRGYADCPFLHPEELKKL